MLFFLAFHVSKNPEKKSTFSIFNIDNIKKHFMSTKTAYCMSSEWSCDSKDYNGCWKFSLDIIFENI